MKDFSLGQSDGGFEVLCELYICLLLYGEWSCALRELIGGQSDGRFGGFVCEQNIVFTAVCGVEVSSDCVQ